MDFSARLGRTAEGRLNDYVTTTPLRLSVNNNRSLGGISGPRKIKGEREADDEVGGGGVYGDLQRLRVRERAESRYSQAASRILFLSSPREVYVQVATAESVTQQSESV